MTDSETEVRYDPGDEAGRLEPARDPRRDAPAAAIADVEAEFDGQGYGALKNAVAEAVVELLRPVQERYAALERDPGVRATRARRWVRRRPRRWRPKVLERVPARRRAAPPHLTQLSGSPQSSSASCSAATHGRRDAGRVPGRAGRGARRPSGAASSRPAGDTDAIGPELGMAQVEADPACDAALLRPQRRPCRARPPRPRAWRRPGRTRRGARRACRRRAAARRRASRSSPCVRRCRRAHAARAGRPRPSGGGRGSACRRHSAYCLAAQDAAHPCVVGRATAPPATTRRRSDARDGRRAHRRHARVTARRSRTARS